MTTLYAATTEYTVVLRTRSAARFLPNEGWELTLNAPNMLPNAVRLRAYTRWVKEGGQDLPRELVVEARGEAASLDEAASKFAVLARPIAMVAGFVANVRVGPLEVHIAYDSTPSHSERAFLEVFLPDERGAVSEGRFIRRHLLEATTMALLGLSSDSDRVSRALRQYEIGLRYWYLGGEWLALSHLWMAAEALTQAVINYETRRRGIDQKSLADALGIPLHDPGRPWKLALKHETRRALIFRGEDDTYRTASKGRNGLEHGFMGIDEVAAHAVKCADKTFEYIRRTAIDLLGLSAEVADELMMIKPKDVESFRKAIRGRLVGEAEDPAPQDGLYPAIEWSSGISSVVREGTTFRTSYTERFTLRTHPNVGFNQDRLEVYGRLEDGKAPVTFSDETLKIEQVADSVARRLLSAVMPLVDSATGTGFHEHSRASAFAFNMFGQAVAYFRSVEALIAAYFPVEALAGLRALTLVAARFEQMAAADGPGFGIAVRSVLDSIAQLAQRGGDPELAAAKAREIQEAAQSSGFSAPSQLAPPETTSIFHRLGAEMNMGESVADGGYGAVHLHTAEVSEEHVGFQVALEYGPLADLVASAAVIAMLDTLMHAAQLFGWTLNSEAVAKTMEEARTLNEAAADLNLRPPGDVFKNEMGEP